MDENRESGRVSLGLSVVVRVTLRDGVYHEVLDALDLSHGGRT
jgi:recombination DNA repair RAD52 pathway protein